MHSWTDNIKIHLQIIETSMLGHIMCHSHFIHCSLLLEGYDSLFGILWMWSRFLSSLHVVKQPHDTYKIMAQYQIPYNTKIMICSFKITNTYQNLNYERQVLSYIPTTSATVTRYRNVGSWIAPSIWTSSYFGNVPRLLNSSWSTETGVFPTAAVIS